MSELRKDPIVDRWVIINEESGHVPHFEPDAPQTDEICPFCRGSEHFCPPNILSSRAADGNWGVRVLPSRAPMLRVEEGDVKRSGEGLFDKINGIGAHEVIIETPHHGVRQADLTVAEIENIFWAYRDRILDLERDGRLRYVLVYKNQGSKAGATVLNHSYSLLAGLPIVPRLLQEELAGARQHYDYKHRCIYCDIIAQERSADIRLIAETRDCVALAPFAPRVPFEVWILPKRHSARFVVIEPGELHNLAIMFKEVLQRLDKALACPDYNYVIHASPFNSDCEKYYHWHMEILPMLDGFSGFESGADMFVNHTSPEEAARYLKQIRI